MTGPDRRAVAIAGHTGDEATARAGLDSPAADVRAAALGALGRLGALDDEAVAAALTDAAVVVRRRAATLAATRPAVGLLAALGDADVSVVEVAAWACGERDQVLDDDTFAAVLAVANDREGDALARESAVAALGAIGDDRGLDAILAGTTDKPAIRRRAVLALAPFLADDHPRVAEVLAALDTARADRDWQVRQAAEDLTPT